MSEHQFISFDETPVYYRHLETVSPSKAILIIVHGMGEHGGRYQDFAQSLVGFGIESFIPDLRGFGKSGGKRACVKKFSDYHRDLEALHSFVARHHKETPIFLMGHSFGGLIASSYLAFSQYPKTRGLVLTSPLYGIALPVPLWRHCLGMLLSVLAGDHCEPSNVNPAFLTHDRELLGGYPRDPLIFHNISARLYREFKTMMDRKNEMAAKLTLPVLMLQAGEDFVVSKDRAIEFYDQIRSTDKELEVYEGFYHEILNEIKRDSVYSRIGTWLLKHSSC